MATDVATLSIKVDSGDVDKAAAKLKQLENSGAAAEVSLLSLKTAAIAAGGALVLAIGHKIVEESIESQNAVAQLDAAVRSTGGAAGFTSKQLQDMASNLEDVSTFGDEAVMKMQSLLLTFTNIRGDTFKEASDAVVDLATRMGGDLQGAAIQVGKALNDPIQGISALQRVGVSFTESQKEMIKTLVESGRGVEAQKIILAELRTEFGGSAEAARNTLGGALAHLSNEWGNLFEVSKESSGGVIVALNAMADAIPHVRDAIGTFVTNTVVGANNIYFAFAKLNNILSFDLTKSWSQQASEIKKANAALEEERLAANAMAHSTGEGTEQLEKNTSALNFNTGAQKDNEKALRRKREEQERAIISANAQNAAEVRQARQAYDIAALRGEQADRLRVEQQRINELADVETEVRRRNVGATEAEKKATEEWADARRRAINVAAQWNTAAAVSADIAERQRQAEEKAAREQERRVRQVTKQASDIAYDALNAIAHRQNPFQVWWDQLKNAVNRGLANIIGDKVGAIYEQLTGRGPNAAATKNLTAGQTMNAAADKMIAAANTMSGAATTASAGNVPNQQGTLTGQTPAHPQLTRALGFAGIAAAGLETGYGIGGALYSTSHGALGNYARGALGGAGAGALAGAAIGSVVPGIGTAVGAAAGAIAGFVGGILGVGSASKEAKRQLAELQKTLSDDMASLRATVMKDTLGAGTAEIEADREKRRRQIEEAYQGGGANSDTVRRRNELLKEMNALEDERIRQLKEETVVMQRRQVEDYEVRRLRATPGMEQAADARAFSLEQQREREDLIRSFGPEIDAREQATLAALDAAQAAERLKHDAEGAAGALNAVASSVRNAPAGLWVEQYVRDFAQRAPARPGLMPPSGPTDGRPSAPVSGGTLNIGTMVLPPIPANVTDPVEFAKKAMEGFRRMIDLTGINATIADTIEAAF